MTFYHFYPRSPRGERHVKPMKKGGKHHISIHAPREGSDFSDVPTFSDKGISIHAPREGSDRSGVGYWYSPSLFLSTLPARGATSAFFQFLLCTIISIHAPREGSDRSGAGYWYSPSLFLSTLPARGATGPKPTGPRSTTDFYPRSPRGERPPAENSPSPLSTFLSTLPARGATLTKEVNALDP